MPESKAHKKAKREAPGTPEVTIRGGRRLDSADYRTATEIERSGDRQRLEYAARKLRDSGRPYHVLRVPQSDLDKAVAAMRKVRTSGVVTNLSKTKRRIVRP